MSWAEGMMVAPRREKAYMGTPIKRKDRKGNTRWMARVFDQSLGRKRSLGTFEKKSDAQQAINEFYARPQPGRYESCESFATRWVKDYPRPRESTNIHNAERVRKFAEDFKGVKMSDVTRPMARAWALENRSSLSSVRAMFSDAARDEIVLRNPFAEMRLSQSKGRKGIAALTEDELHELADMSLKVFPGIAGQTLRAMILFSGYNGVRIGELCALKRMDLGHDELTVRRAWVAKTRTIGSTKNGLERTIVMAPETRVALRGLPMSVKQPEFVFTNPRDGKHFTPNSLGYYWRQIRAAAGRSSMDWHELRHCCATMLLARGVPHHVVAHQLGHTDGGKLIMSTYGHPAEVDSREQIKRAWGGSRDGLRVVGGTRTGTSDGKGADDLAV